MSYSKALHFKNSAYQAHFAQGITIIKCLARLGRKSLSFSKSVELHDKVIGHYLNIKHYQ
nr:IS1 family transposase [Escherichia coli]